MKTLKLSLCLIIVLITISSCEKENELNNSRTAIEGFTQKGPFLSGSNVEIYELSQNLFQTGTTFSSQVTTNGGKYRFDSIPLTSQYQQFIVKGKFYNEVQNQNSKSEITLNAIADISENSAVNVNLITHLEKARVEYLVQTEGKSFADAKKEATQDVLGIFSIQKADIENAELLDISKQGDDHAILLAISLITQGFRSEDELNSLVADIIEDIKTDGKLDDESLGSALLNQALLLQLPIIRDNLETYYEQLGMTAIIPEFEKYIKIFIENTDFTTSTGIEYPEFSEYGVNILFGDKSTFGSQISMAAELPQGSSLKVIIRGSLWYFRVDPNGPINWEYTIFGGGEQTFTSIVGDSPCDLSIEFEPGTYTIEIYENETESPTRVKTIEM